MQIIRLNETTAALIEIPFTSVSSADLQTRLLSTDIANSAITVKIKRGGVGPAVAGGAGTFTATDDVGAPGMRGYCPATSELFIGVSTFIFTGTGMEPREMPVTVRYADPYEPAYYGSVVAGTLTTSSFSTNRPETQANAFSNAVIEFLTGPNTGSVAKVASFTGTGTVGTFTVAAGFTLPATPTAGDTFRILVS